MAETDNQTPADEPWEYKGPLELEIVCTRPIKLHDKDPNVLTSFTLCEPTIEQMAAYTDKVNATRNDFAGAVVLISKNSGISEAQAKKLSIRDFEKALAFLTGFTQPLPTTGAD